MINAADHNFEEFRALYPELGDRDIEAAYECFRRYVQLALEVAQNAAPNVYLTDGDMRGTVVAGTVDPTRTFTNIG